MNLALLIGSWYRALGWISVAANVLGLLLVFWTDALIVDLSFLLWFWLGGSIREGLAIGRNWAVGVCACIAIAIALAVAFGKGTVRVGDLEAGAGDLIYYLGASCVFVVVALPGLLMLHPKAWRWCSAMETHPLDKHE